MEVAWTREAAMPEPQVQSSELAELRSLFRVNSIAPMVAPVSGSNRRRARTARHQPSLRQYRSSPNVTLPPVEDAHRNSVGDDPAEEAKFPLPDKVHAWARYGFIDEKYLLPERDESDIDSPSRRARDVTSGESREHDAERVSNLENVVPWDRASSVSGPLLQAPPRPPQHHQREQEPSSAAGRTSLSSGRPRAMSEPSSPNELGTSTPPTVILTPSSQERCRAEGKQAEGEGGAVSVAPLSEEATDVGAGRIGDSMAASFAAAASAQTATAAAAAAAAAAPETIVRTRDVLESGTDIATSGGETKEDDWDMLRADETEGIRNQGATAGAVSDRDVNGTTRTNSASIGLDERGRNAGVRRRPARTIAEVERHKRNRAERLRAYGCQRVLYPRIVPGAAAVAGVGGGFPITEEMETAQWVETLRVSASVRGESLMAESTQSFVEDKAATLLEDKQSEARAWRTADVSEMEGPDGLLHCAVLKGEHALAARAAQFLVDKKGASVNSRDAWGRTPLHTAAGKGMVAMARFFIRRGANVDALDQDDRTPLFFACAGGNATMARYLTRIEVGAKVDQRDNRGHLAGECFWDSVGAETRNEILAILVNAGWPDPPPPRHITGRSRSTGRGVRLPKRRDADGRTRHSEGSAEREGDVGVRRLATDMMHLVRGR